MPLRAVDHDIRESIGRAVADIAEAKRHLDTTVRSAREAGFSWTEIGDVLGTSRQAAWERFSAATQRVD